MHDKASVKEELAKLSPFLAKMKEQQKADFKVPEKYFQNLESDLIKIAQGHLPEKKNPWIDRLFEYLQLIFQPRLAVGLATMVVLLIGAAFWSLNDSKKGPGNSLTEEEITTYVIHNIDEFETDLFIEAFGNELNIDLFSKESFDDQEVEQVYEDLLVEVELDDLEKLL